MQEYKLGQPHDEVAKEEVVVKVTEQGVEIKEVAPKETKKKKGGK